MRGICKEDKDDGVLTPTPASLFLTQGLCTEAEAQTLFQRSTGAPNGIKGLVLILQALLRKSPMPELISLQPSQSILH